MFRHVLIPISPNSSSNLKPKRAKQPTSRAGKGKGRGHSRTSQSIRDESPEMPELSEFEKERLANIKQRDELLQKLRQEVLSAGLFPVTGPKPPSSARRPPSSHKRIKRELAETPKPTRSSARLRGLQADSVEAKRRLDEAHEAVRQEQQRKRTRVSGDLKVEDIIVGGTRWNNGLKGLGLGPGSAATRWQRAKEEEQDEEDQPPREISKEVASTKERFGQLRVWDQWESTRLKITPERIYAMAFHPTDEKPIIFAGDKLGHLGILDASQTSSAIKSEERSDEVDGEADDDPDPVITTIKPHSRTISSIFIHRARPAQLYTSSYDSSVRVLDIESQTVTEAYAPSNANDEDPLSGVELHPTEYNTLYFTSLEGNFGCHDMRTRTRQGARIYALSEKKIGGFSLCPTSPNYFATASLDRYMRVWDLRFLKAEESIPVGEHLSALSVSHAAFNTTGQVVTSSYDNTLKVHDLAKTGIFSGTEAKPKQHALSANDMDPATVIRHNCQTGRWVTILRPQWQLTPAFAPTVQRFTIGNMNRYVDVYAAEGTLLARLGGAEDNITAVPAVTAMHPVKDWVAGGTASGRVGLWM